MQAITKLKEEGLLIYPFGRERSKFGVLLLAAFDFTKIDFLKVSHRAGGKDVFQQ